jgi:hypothetical protein
LKPKALREQIEEKTLRTPKYMYYPANLFDLIIKYGNRFEYTFRRLQQNKEDDREEKDNKQLKSKYNRKNAENDRKVEAHAANNVEAVRFVKRKGATCDNCNEQGHYFLRYDKSEKGFVKNCPKPCDAKRYNELHRSITERLGKKKQENKNAKQFKARQANFRRNRGRGRSYSGSRSPERTSSSSYAADDHMFTAFKAFLAGYNSRGNDLNVPANSARGETLDIIA